MLPKSIVGRFVETLASNRNPDFPIAINISSYRALELLSAETMVEGFDWLDHVQPSRRFDFVVADLPLGMGRERIRIGRSTISVRRNWAELTKALRLLTPNGLCLAIVEPPAFGISEGPRFQEALEKEGFYLTGVFNCPPNILNSTSIRPVIVALSRSKQPSLFVAELEEESQAETVAQAFSQGISADSLHEGMALESSGFTGFESLKVQLQLERLETQYKDYTSYILGDISVEINTVESGGFLERKENAIYVPLIGSSAVTADLSAVTIKHHNIIQVVLADVAKSQYVAAFFRSDLGLLILRSLTRGGVIPRIKKSDLYHARVAIPSAAEQEEIVHSHEQLQNLTAQIATLQAELALNPRSASSIRGQVERMLETIGALTEADRIMNLAREGESATVEFKTSFSLDVRKGTKEKYIELSALKTIAAFLNTNGGILLVGVTDAGETPGIESEVKKFHKNNDAFLLHFKNQLKQRIGEQYYPFISQKLVEIGEVCILIIECNQATSPCYLDGKEFYVRTNPATDKLEGPKLVEYVQNHFNKSVRI